MTALLKSHKDLENDIIERLKQLHSYDTAAILVVDVQASSSEFQDWILQQTRSS